MAPPMVEELGLEPSPCLQRLERAILDQGVRSCAGRTRAGPQRELRSAPGHHRDQRLSSRRVALLVAGGGGLLTSPSPPSPSCRAPERAGRPRLTDRHAVALQRARGRRPRRRRSALGRRRARAPRARCRGRGRRVGGERGRENGVHQIDPRSLRVPAHPPDRRVPERPHRRRATRSTSSTGARRAARPHPARLRPRDRSPAPAPRTAGGSVRPRTDRFELDPTAVAVGAGSVWIRRRRGPGSCAWMRRDDDAASVDPGRRAGHGRRGWIRSGMGDHRARRCDSRRPADGPRHGSHQRREPRHLPTLRTRSPSRPEQGSCGCSRANTATVRKIEPRTGAAVVATTRVGVDRSPTSLAAGDDAAWVGQRGRNADAHRCRAATAVRTITVGHGLRDVAGRRRRRLGHQPAHAMLRPGVIAATTALVAGVAAAGAAATRTLVRPGRPRLRAHVVPAASVSRAARRSTSADRAVRERLVVGDPALAEW